MIVVVGGNGGGGGLLLSLIVMALFLLVPFLLLRGATRRVAVGSGGWVPVGPGWQQQPAGGWQPPPEPVLPPVSPADVASLRDRLGHDVRTLEPGDDPVARQAMADAAERYATCRTLLEQANSQARLRTAWLAAVEGLTASRLVRTRLGLDPGPQIPLPPAGPQLQGPSRLDVGGRSYVGGPSYEPGRPHWFPGGSYGGRYVPGGWYDTPFWPGSLLLGGLGGLALGSALTSVLAGPMYGDDLAPGGYDLDGGGWVEGGGWGADDGGFGGFGGGGGWGGGSGGWGDGGGGDWGDGGGGDWGSGGGGDFGGGDGGW